jgi:hypothetical protein
MCGWAGALVAGVLLFGGCEKEGVGEKGALVGVSFALGGVDFGDSGDLGDGGALRGEGALGTEGTLGTGGALGETVIVPLDEEFCVYATLKEEDNGGLRGKVTIATNTKLMVVAFKGGVEVTHAEYFVANGSGDIEPVSSPGLTVASGDTYQFVAYSVNSTASVPAYANPLVVAPDVDLLWGTSAEMYVGGGVSVTIDMFHKFSRVTVVATSVNITPTAAISNVTNVSITPAYNASLNLVTGVPGKGAGTTQPIASWTGSGTTTVTGAARLVHTGGDQPVRVAIESMKVGTATYANKAAQFDMALEEGKKYTLTIDVKRNLVWAGSNIYWDNSKLTFDAPTSDVDTQRKQGVYFRWGGLVGVSGEVKAVMSFSIEWEDITVYIPTYTVTFGQTPYITWSTTNIYTQSSNIPSVGLPWQGIEFYGDRLNTFWNISNDWNGRTGDICRFLSENGCGPSDGKTYRMPTSFEFGEKESYSYGAADGWSLTGSWGNETPSSIHGTSLMNTYVVSSGGVIFPNPGSQWDYSRADYWSTSFNRIYIYNTMPNIDVWVFRLNSGGIQNVAVRGASNLFSVRCVQVN